MKSKQSTFKVSCILLSILIAVINIPMSNSYAEGTIEDVKAPINLLKEIEKNYFKVDEEFTINYTVHPEPIPADDIIPETYSKEKEIVLVMDTSGSMDWGLDGNKYVSYENKRMTIAKNAAKLFVDKFENNDKVKIGLVDYDTKAHIERVDGNILVNKRKFTNLKNRINHGLKAKGATNIGDGLRRAYWILKNSPNNEAKKYIILMTDGEPTALSYDRIEGHWALDGYWPVWVEYPIYKLDDGVVSNNKIWNYGSYDPDGYALEYAKTVATERVSTGDPHIDTFILGFSDDVNKDKLQQVSNSANGFYKEAKTAEDINEVYEKLADEIQSDLPIHSIEFNETFPEGLDVIEASEGLEINGQIVTGDIGSITYVLNENTNKFEANPISFSINLKASEAGNYSLSMYNDNNSSFIAYKDIDGTDGKKNFSILDISVYEEIIAPEVSIKVSDANGLRSTYIANSDNEDKRVDKLLNPSVILKGDAFADIDIKAKDVNFFEYQFISSSETPNDIPTDNWKSIDLNEETINQDVVIEKQGFLNKRAYDVSHMPTLSGTNKWKKAEEVFKSPFDATTYMSADYSLTPAQYGKWEDYFKADGSLGKRWVTNSIFMKNMNVTGANGNENYKESSKFWGYIKIPSDGEYKFGAFSDDGFRGYITVDGETNIFANMFKPQGSTYGTSNEPFDLEADKYYPIYLEYFNWGGWAHFEITYSDDGSSPKERVPGEWLYPSKNITPGEYATTIFTGSKGVKFPSESGDYYIAFRTGNDDDVTREGLYGPFTVDGNTSLNLSKAIDENTETIQTNEEFNLEYTIKPQNIVPRSTFKNSDGTYKEKIYLSNVKIQDEYPEGIEIKEENTDNDYAINGQKITANVSDIEYILIDKEGSKVYSAQPVTVDVKLSANVPGEYILSEEGKSIVTFDDFNEAKPQFEFDSINVNIEEKIPIKDVEITDVDGNNEAKIVENGKLIVKITFELEREVERLGINLESVEIDKFDFKKMKLIRSVENMDEKQIVSDWDIDNDNNVINIESNPAAGDYEILLELNASNPNDAVHEGERYKILIEEIDFTEYDTDKLYIPEEKPDLDIYVDTLPKIL